jgi:hypothetical protein
MSQLATGIFGAIAISLTCGAVQFASGRDLSGVPQASLGVSEAINRATKADRAVVVAAAGAQTQTISLRLDGVSNTSVLVRIPVFRETRNLPSAPSVTRPGNRKMTVACEPVVSMLTEVAKLLQPGRCIT